MPSLLVLSFFPAFTPASSGGELRLGNLYRALSRSHEITLITSTDFGARFEEIVHTPTFRELRFPKDELWRNAYATLERTGVQGDLAGLAFALAVSEPSCRLRQVARELAVHVDAVSHEFPFSEPIFSDGCPTREIYNSHNFEASLLSSIVRGEGFEAALLKLIRLEGNLVARAHRVLATSSADADKFRLFYGVDAAKLVVCPNGFDDSELQPVVLARHSRGQELNPRPQLLFTGSGHHPNVEAAAALVEMAGDLPECDIVLAGGLCGAFSDRTLPENVIAFGSFSPEQKQKLLTGADLYVNSVLLGSGTSLKALEALGAAIPMVSTPEGVRGLDLASGVHCEIVSREEFPTAIRRLLAEPSARQRLAAAGLDVARHVFSWERIARDLGETIAEELPDPKPARPLVLELNDYAVLQPGSGGIARVRSLVANVNCDVVLVSFGSAFEAGLISPGVLHVTVPKTVAHRAFEDAVNQGEPMSVNDGVASLFAGSNRALTTVVSAIALRAEAVVFEHPYMAPVLDAIRAVRPDLPIVYSSHNVEATHKAAILRHHRIGETLTRFIAELEERLVAEAKLIVCCTDADADYFSKSGVETIMVANGCVLPEEATLREGRETMSGDSTARVGFLGSGHGPNAEAADFIIEELAPAFPGVSFELVGSVCTAISLSVSKNVLLHGIVSEAAKSMIMAGWDVALNPVESGGGSSLKLPDYMAHGVASLSSPAGARGFDVAGRGAGRVAERRQFRLILAEMLANPAELVAQRDKARRYATEHLGWTAITETYRARLRTLLTPASPAMDRRKLLVVTYRYTEPPLGGAEEYLIEVLKRMRPRFDRIDLATIDIDHLTNHHHFGCRMSYLKGGASLRLAELFDRALFFPPEELPEAEMLARARDLERAWTREERELLAPFAAHLAAPGLLRVFGGFFWPENHGGVIRRWTSPEFSFLVPSSARTFQMVGYASVDKTLSLTLMTVAPDGQTEILATYQQMIPPYFTINVTLRRRSGSHPLVLLCKVDEHQAEGDHRPFGVLLESAIVLLEEEESGDGGSDDMTALGMSIADLTEQHDDSLRTERFEEWVSALRDAARRRNATMEADFAAVRGPHSAALQEWLTQNGSNYDTVLVQGIPFDVIPRTVQTLAALPSRPRIVTLPHFHGDDRFYHWNRYFESFRTADKTLLFSSSIADQLGTSDRYVVVPGGGVSADEHGDPTAIQRFRAVHGSEAPFFLVLGRKTASKGYEQAVRAHQTFRKKGANVDLILIGPDEDGREVKGEGVHYLGRQPRDVIRGALASCVALITMSRSESFGIVLCEAWLFGKPVIANRACYSFRELVQNGKTGLLCSTDRDVSLAMTQIYEDTDLRDRIGQAGFEETLMRFSWEKVSDSVLRAGGQPDH